MTPDLSYELEGEREARRCAKIINGMRERERERYMIRRYLKLSCYHPEFIVVRLFVVVGWETHLPHEKHRPLVSTSPLDDISVRRVLIEVL